MHMIEQHKQEHDVPVAGKLLLAGELAQGTVSVHPSSFKDCSLKLDGRTMVGNLPHLESC